jgi:hypothetical protein
MLVVERKHGGAGGENGRDDGIVVPELDAPRHCGGDPRGDLENEHVDTKMVCHTRFAMSALLELLFSRLRRGEEGQGRSRRDRAAGTEQGARKLLRRRQRRVVLERLRERRGARVSDMVVPQAAAKEKGQGCSWRDRAAGTEQGARDLLERCQQAQIIRKLVTIPPLLAP